MSAEAAAITAWIIAQGLESGDLDAVLGGTAERLAAAGIPLSRMHVSFPTLNPEVRGRNHVWTPGGGTRLESLGHDRYEDAFCESPFAGMVRDGIPLRRWRLDGPGDVSTFPLLRELRRAGATEYVATVTGFAGPAALPGTAISCGTDRPGGFTDREIGRVLAVVPALALAAYRITLGEVAADLLGAYLGHDPARRVLAGEIRRGQGQRVEGALLFADLAGFTGAAERGGAALVARLGEHLAAMVEPVEAEGGEVLKFMGDGVLAGFPIGGGGRDAAEACRAALAAALRAIGLNDAVNARWPDEAPLGLDVGLHRGEVFYGNVGAGSRLDFTVIGPAVNQASRLEALCGPLRRPVLMSRAFAERCGRPVTSLGIHLLKGVPESQEIFGLT